MSTEPTPAEIEAGAAGLAGSQGYRYVNDEDRSGAEAVLRAVLPDHDARVRTAALRHAAQEVHDRLGVVLGQEQLTYAAAAGDAVGLLERLADEDGPPADREAEIRADERAKVAEQIATALERVQLEADALPVEYGPAMLHAAAIARQHTTGEDPT